MRVWLNHWFSTAYYFIESLQTSGHYVIATNKSKRSVYASNADEFYVEPNIEGEEYLEFCKNFCKEHYIDVFLPRRGLEIIISHLAEFDEIGVKVLCETDIDLYKTFQSKVKTASYFKNLNVVSVPEQILVNSYEEFLKAYGHMRDAYDFGVCIKYDCDEGGQSFKRIVARDGKLSSALVGWHGFDIDLDYLCQCLRTAGKFKPLVVMPYLQGIEVSVDCFGVGNKFFAVPRFKLGGRITELKFDAKLYSICREFWRASGLKAPFNVQFILQEPDFEPQLLEVNTRLSGGVWKDTHVGFDFVNMAVGSIIGDGVSRIDSHFETTRLANLETVVWVDADE